MKKVNSSRGFGKGKSPTKFSYTYEDLGTLLGCSTAAARKHAQRGHFNPRDLLSVLEFVRDRLRQGQKNLDEDKSLTILRQINETKKST